MRGQLTVAAILAVPVLYYLFRLAVFPWRDCWWCKGRGWFRSKSNGKLSRGCRGCGYTGKRLRIVRRMWNRARRTAREAA